MTHAEQWVITQKILEIGKSELSRRSGISLPTIYKFAKDGSEVSLNTAKKICKQIGVRITFVDMDDQA